jgi:nicotinamide riboside transporter PnuC
MWVVTGLSILGTVLNIKKVKWCFWIWLFTNLSWCIYDVIIKNYAQAVLFAVYTGLAIYGIVEWSKRKKNDR